jgi:putative hydroxymethylpyrimidine transporter CytX
MSSSAVSSPGTEPSRGAPAVRAEAPRTLAEPAPRALGLADQLGFWGNLGISLLGFGGAVAVQAPAGLPALSTGGALAAIVVGTLLGSAVLGASLVLGARTGAPAMVLLRGVLGGRASGLPTVLNIVQCLGWGTFELVVIARGLGALTHGALPRWAGVLIAGLVTTGLTLRPLGVIRVLRRYVLALVVVAVALLTAGLLTTPAPAPGGGSWTGWWAGVDAALAVAISWVPLGADYSRHSTTDRAAFGSGFLGFGVAQIGCYAIGLLALARAGQDPARVFDVFLGLPLGLLALAVLVLRETDQSFANVYSTAVSVQNLRPAWDRRPLAAAIGVLTTAAALVVDIEQFSAFLYLIGAVFVPLSGVLLAAWARARGQRWDLAASAPARPAMLVAWATGFVVYQLVNPGAVPGWSAVWSAAAAAVHLTGVPWLSASVTSFVAAFAVAVLTPVSAKRGVTPVSAKRGVIRGGARPRDPAGARPGGSADDSANDPADSGKDRPSWKSP